MLVADSSGSLTPKASTSFNIDEIPLIDGFSIPKEPIIPFFATSPNPMSKTELEISPGRIVNNMTTYQGLTINEMSVLFDKFLSNRLNTLDEVKAFIKLRRECINTENENFNFAYENVKEYITILEDDMERIMEAPRNDIRLGNVKTCLMRFEQVWSQFPHINNLGLVEALDTYNMSMYPALFHNPDQDVYDLDALARYVDQLGDNLDQESDLFDKIKKLYGDELGDLYNEIERLNYLPKNSYTNKALYEVYLKTFEVLYRYPSIEDIDLIHKSPFIQPKTSELLSIENISEI
jgi:hypothetical protein